ncbi:MAG: T9SS type A sorting domain-containing protein [Candidatus Cloacimonadaceae bacterium]|jgi:hypothetical protein|nr:T9SS type A sorting domain-containing protein [Candidatus Cloacimonadaceae bacterium]
MKRTILILGILSIIFGLQAYLIENASLESFLIRHESNSAYDNWISHLAEGVVTANYNIYAPYDRQSNDFGDYTIPNAIQLAQWANIVDLFLTGLLEESQAAIDDVGFPYQVVQFNDTDSGRTYYMLREIPDDSQIDNNGTEDTYDDEIGAFTYGWGLYIYNPQATRNRIIITVPHPTDDFATPIMGYDAMNNWDAGYLMIAGAGREVKWSNSGTYTNSKSISDPTRAADHPFNVCYQKFADKIRAETSQREFSFQVHSYDWNRHVGYTDNQISAGYNKLCPNLPIRDLSSLKKDLINRGSHLMIPANTIGSHDDVFLNQYYSVNYSIHDFTFTDGEIQYPVNDQIDLPAYSQNRQMLYTLSGWTDYDSFEPFFHIEMDELPNAYEETENNYKWFYGWNAAQDQWDMENLFSNTRRYYSRWVTDLNSLYDDLFAMNDGLTPPTPQNLHVINSSMYYVTLGWEPSDSYDFDSYEILYATSPVTEDNFQIYDRGNNAYLASLGCSRINVTGLSNTSNYFFKIRARDKNGNYSDLSDEVTTAPAPANVTNFTAHGMSNGVRIFWTVGGQSGLQGFKIHRIGSDGTDAIIASYETDPSLVVGNTNYEYWDLFALPGVDYSYTLGMVDGTNYEFIHNAPQPACLGPIRELLLSTVSFSHSDILSLGNNNYASDGSDAYWDVTKGNPSTGYVWIASWQPYWGNNGTSLSREIRGGYDLDSEVKSWTIRVRSDQLNVPLQIELIGLETRSEKMYLYDSGTGSWHNLGSGPYQFTVANTNVRTMTLHWGNLQPSASHAYMANQIFQGGSEITMGWSFQNSFLIDHFDLYIKNATDSLLVLANYPANATNYTYILPQSIDMPEANVYLDVTATDGILTTYQSAHTLAFVPKMNLIYCEPGWITKSNPFMETNFSIEDIFGAGAAGYAWDDEWLNVLDFDFNTPYFVHATDYVFNSTTSAVQNTEVFVELVPGWNFVANPHLCSYDIASLRFLVNGNIFRYSEMIDQGLISRAVYVYRNNSYQIVESIQAHEAFFINSYAVENMNVQLSFYPYFIAPAITPPAPNWSVKVVANQADEDSFSFGASPIAANGYDFRMDLPKAPEKTLFSGITAYLYSPEDTQLSALQEEFRANFPSAQEQDMVFNFAITVPNTDPVQFTFQPQNVPNHWTLRFVMDGIPMSITEEAVYEFTPPEAGTYEGYIRVSNHYVSNNDLVQGAISQLKVYPNPFNPSTTIRFNNALAQDVKVDIFNIRGQKVCQLHNGNLRSGMHSIEWLGRDERGRSVASGIYFARIQTANNSKSIKMMLMK